jgi:hypothetical protein
LDSGAGFNPPFRTKTAFDHMFNQLGHAVQSICAAGSGRPVASAAERRRAAAYHKEVEARRDALAALRRAEEVAQQKEKAKKNGNVSRNHRATDRDTVRSRERRRS